MTILRRGALAGALVASAVAGAAFMPPVHGQSRERDTPARLLQVLGRDAQIGVSVRDSDAGEKTGGVIVDEVRTGSPAEKAGFKRGDAIVEFDGERVRSVAQFRRLVQETPEERSAPTVVLRDGQRVTLTVTPDRPRPFYFDDDFSRVMPAIPQAPMPPATPRAPRAIVPSMPDGFESFTYRSWDSRLGVTAEGLTPQLREYFGVKGGGVLVRSVSDGSAAAKAGLKAGDVIVGANGHPVDQPSDLADAIHGDGEFTLEVMRDRKTMTVKGKQEPREARSRSRIMM